MGYGWLLEEPYISKPDALHRWALIIIRKRRRKLKMRT